MHMLSYSPAAAALTLWNMAASSPSFLTAVAQSSQPCWHSEGGICVDDSTSGMCPPHTAKAATNKCLDGFICLVNSLGVSGATPSIGISKLKKLEGQRARPNPLHAMGPESLRCADHANSRRFQLGFELGYQRAF
jgi:hypothetical protein